MAKSATKTGNSPAFTFRRKGVSVSVFENESNEGKAFFKTTVQRSYKDGNDFKTTSSLSRDDIGVAVVGLQKAFEFILDEEAKRNKEES